jgi:hypothetical protein
VDSLRHIPMSDSLVWSTDSSKPHGLSTEISVGLPGPFCGVAGSPACEVHDSEI